MRSALGARDGHRSRYQGTFVREGTKRAFKGPPLPTVLLADVQDAVTGRQVTDHLWSNRTQAFFDLTLKPSDVVEFEGRVEAYEKGYKGRREDVYDAPIETDYKLSRTTKVVRIACGIPWMNGVAGAAPTPTTRAGPST